MSARQEYSVVLPPYNAQFVETYRAELARVQHARLLAGGCCQSHLSERADAIVQSGDVATGHTARSSSFSGPAKRADQIDGPLSKVLHNHLSPQAVAPDQAFGKQRDDQSFKRVNSRQEVGHLRIVHHSLFQRWVRYIRAFFLGRTQ